ncbi:MAG: XisI protein [Okeania sp. SIO2C9]|uniref:element excision factor XisI family protein n=1 Tax=Okeania sp. SIO2C9 TaxID=2607791 RepID=UPI0013C14C2B|nr:element excision factor XisI family protein [Okeania sp. SIO2C9]NEQ73267.1 XisI protein [Okeania sp. SIO2C9]
MTQEWEDDIQVHGCLVHIEIIGDKLWIHRGGLEDGIAKDIINRRSITLIYRGLDIFVQQSYSIPK